MEVELDKSQGQCFGKFGRLWLTEVNEWACEQKCKYTSEDIVACMFYWNRCWLYTREQFGNQPWSHFPDDDSYAGFICWFRKGI